MKAKKSSKLLLKRLVLYLDHLKSLPDTVTNISATTIARALDLGEVLVRKDLARVSSNGRKKTGHLRRQLIQDIEYYLDFGDSTNVVVVGVGKLGQALLGYSGFRMSGIKLMAGFDIHPEENCCESIMPVYPIDALESFCKNKNIHVGIITVPEEAAQEACDRLVSCGIGAIWNFAPTALQVPDHVLLQNENLAISISALRLQLEQQKQEAKANINIS